jgi:hypothetical protein
MSMKEQNDGEACDSYARDGRSNQPMFGTVSPGTHSRAYMSFPAVNWVWAASNANYDGTIWHSPIFESI